MNKYQVGDRILYSNGKYSIHGKIMNISKIERYVTIMDNHIFQYEIEFKDKYEFGNSHTFLREESICLDMEYYRDKKINEILNENR